MKRFHAVLALVVPIACLVVAPVASAQVLKGSTPTPFATNVNFGKPVRLGDGKVLPAGPYDVQVTVNGDGKTAEFVFLQGGSVKGRQRGEARGFSAAGGGTLSPAATQLKYEDAALKDPTTGHAQDKTAPLDTQHKAATGDIVKTEGSGAPNAVKIENEKKYLKYESGAPGSARAFNWGAAGFGSGTQLKQTEGAGTLTLKLDSSNSSAGIIAVLNLVPAVQKK